MHILDKLFYSVRVHIMFNNTKLYFVINNHYLFSDSRLCSQRSPNNFSLKAKLASSSKAISRILHDSIKFLYYIIKQKPENEYSFDIGLLVLAEIIAMILTRLQRPEVGMTYKIHARYIIRNNL